MKGSDAWNEQEDTDVMPDWTHRLKSDKKVKHILDRITHSLPAETVSIKQRGFIGGSDHRPIWATVSLSFVVDSKDAQSIPNPLPQWIKLPNKKDPGQAQRFAQTVDEDFDNLALETLHVTTADGWNTLYEAMKVLLRKSGEAVYELRGTYQKRKKE